MPVAIALPHCEACASSRRTLARVVEGIEQLVTVCDCPCPVCHASHVTIGERAARAEAPTPAAAAVDEEPPESSRRKRKKRARFTTWMRNPLTSRQIQISADTEEELEAYRHHMRVLRRELRLRLKTREEVDRILRRLQHGAYTLERAAVLYAQQPTIAKNTRANVETFLSTIAGPLKTMELDQLDAPTVSAWIESLGTKHRATSIRVYWWRLTGIIRFALERGWIAQAPWGTWTPPKRIRSLKKQRAPREALRSVDELVRLFAGARQVDEAHQRQGMIGDLQAKIATATLCGLRNHELAPLSWPDLDAERCRVRVWQQKPRNERTILTLPELFVLLEEHRKKLEALELYAPNGPVFPSRSSTPGKPRYHTDHQQVIGTEVLRRAVAYAGLPDVDRWSPHSLRDSFATLEGITYGGDLALLKERTGHATIANLLRYLKTRSREPAPPGFRLPPAAARQLLLPTGNTTAAPAIADAAEGGATSSPPSESPRLGSRTGGLLHPLPDVTAPVQDAELIETIADALTERPELVSDRPAVALALPARAPHKKAAAPRRGCRALQGKPPNDHGSSQGERSASLPRRTTGRPRS